MTLTLFVSIGCVVLAVGSARMDGRRGASVSPATVCFATFAALAALSAFVRGQGDVATHVCQERGFAEGRFANDQIECRGEFAPLEAAK